MNVGVQILMDVKVCLEKLGECQGSKFVRKCWGQCFVRKSCLNVVLGIRVCLEKCECCGSEFVWKNVNVGDQSLFGKVV